MRPNPIIKGIVELMVFGATLALLLTLVIFLNVE
jgi:hypothetical protein